MPFAILDAPFVCSLNEETPLAELKNALAEKAARFILGEGFTSALRRGQPKFLSCHTWQFCHLWRFSCHSRAIASSEGMSEEGSKSEGFDGSEDSD
jgi:hypothetical protein